MSELSSGSTLPVPMNICPTPKSLVHLAQRLKRMICLKMDSPNLAQPTNQPRNDRLDGLNIRRGPNQNTNIGTSQHDRFKNEGIFDRRHDFVLNETLTYKIVIERIVKRFLLYYKNKNTGLKESSDGLQVKELKNDISSLRFELLNEVTMVDDARVMLFDNMVKLNEDFQSKFDLERIKHYLIHQ
jgi:transient receptor potential cation channel subfamily C member 6